MSALHRSHRTAPSTAGLAPRPRPEENAGAASTRSGRRRRRGMEGAGWQCRVAVTIVKEVLESNSSWKWFDDVAWSTYQREEIHRLSPRL